MIIYTFSLDSVFSHVSLDQLQVDKIIQFHGKYCMYVVNRIRGLAIAKLRFFCALANGAGKPRGRAPGNFRLLPLRPFFTFVVLFFSSKGKREGKRERSNLLT